MDYMNVDGLYGVYGDYGAYSNVASYPAPAAVRMQASVQVMQMAEQVAAQAGAEIVQMMNQIQGIGQQIDILA